MGRSSILYSLCHPTPSHIQIPRIQRVRFNEGPTWFHVVAHQRAEDLVRRNGVVDLYAQQAAHGGVHGGFPELFGVHFAQAFVALLGDAAFHVGEHPADGVGEAGDGLLLVAAAHDGAGLDEAGDGFGGLADDAVVAGAQEVGVDLGALAVAVVHA